MPWPETYTLEDCRKMVEVERRYYPDVIADPENLYACWKRNPFMFVSLRDADGAIKGFWNSFPVTPRLYAAFLSGDYCDTSITPEDVLPFQAGEQMLYWYASALHPDMRKQSGSGRKLGALWVGHLERLYHEKGVVLNRVFCDAVTDAGIRSSNRLGLKPVAGTRRRSTIMSREIPAGTYLSVLNEWKERFHEPDS